MSDTLIWEGLEYELPKKTLTIQKKLDEIGNLTIANKGYEGYLKTWALITELLGKDNAEKVLEANSVNDVDLQTLTICYNSIVYAYTQRVREYNMKQESEQIDTPTLRAISSVANNVDKLQKIK